MSYKCPHCGVSMRRELNGSVLTHPVVADCTISGKAFKLHRSKSSDKRQTWAEYCAKAGATPVEAPVTPTPVKQDFAQTGPVAPTPAPTPVAAPNMPPAPAPAPGMPVAPPARPE